MAYTPRTWTNEDYENSDANDWEGRIAAAFAADDTRMDGIDTAVAALDTRQDAVELLTTRMTRKLLVADSYSCLIADAGKMIEFPANANAKTLTLPAFGTEAIPTEAIYGFMLLGVGDLTISHAGVTYRAKGGVDTVTGTYATFFAAKRAASDWHVYGDLG